MANENGKDVANSLSSYSNALNKGTNVVLDSANQINKWYAEQVNKIAEGENQDTRLETNVDNSIVEDTEEKISKIQTKVDYYTEIQTNNKNKMISNQNTGRLKTINTDETLEEVVEKENEVKDLGAKKGKINSKIATAIKGAKLVNNTANRFVKTGKTLNTATNEGGLKSFEKSSSRVMTKPARKVADKVTAKATNIIKKTGVKATKRVVKETTNIVVKATKVAMKIVAEADRDLEPEIVFRRAVQFGLAHYPEFGKEQQWKRFKDHMDNKYSLHGYIKLWIPGSDNERKLNELRSYIADCVRLRKMFERIYNEENGSRLCE